MDEVFEFPSGLRARFRSLQVKDEACFSDLKLNQEGRLIPRLLESCFLELVDSGPYQFHGDKVDWLSVLQGDGYYGFFQLRVLTYGDDYDFIFACEQCRRNSDASIKLSEMKVIPLPEASKRALREKGHFAATLGGKQIVYRLLLLGDEKSIVQLRASRKLDPRLAALTQRIVSVEGITEGNIGGVVRFLEGLDASEVGELERTLEEQDCGIDNWINVDCKHCYFPSRLLLPFGPTFYSKRRRYLGGDSTSTIG